MVGLGPAIHERKLVDPRVKPGDDNGEAESPYCSCDDLNSPAVFALFAPFWVL